MFAPASTRPRRASHVSFAEQLDGNEEQGVDHHVEPSDDDEGVRRVPDKDRSESTREELPAETSFQLPPHEATNGGASDTTQPMHEDADSQDSYERLEAIDAFDVAQEYMSPGTSLHPDDADLVFANGALGASSTVAGTGV
jgi:hypothetical protein